MTNGVSFSLVVGACCCIKMTNKSSVGSTWSMNINSTGAKTVNLYTVTGSWSSPSVSTYPSTHDTLTTTVPLFIFLVYDGSSYSMSDGNYLLPYPDYND